MATYPAVLIGTNFIGSDSVQVTQSNGDGSLQRFLSSVNKEPYVIDSLDLWTDSDDQLLEPIGLVQLDPAGNYCRKIVVPQKDVDQQNNALNGVSAQNFPMDENTRLSYNILPGATIKLKLNINNTKDNNIVVPTNCMEEPEEIKQPEPVIGDDKEMMALALTAGMVAVFYVAGINPLAILLIP